MVIRRDFGAAKTKNENRSHVQVRRKGSNTVTPLAFIASRVKASFVCPVLPPRQQVSESQSGSLI